MRVLVACEFSGIVREAFRAIGHDARSCDLLDTEIPGQHIKDDVLKHLEDGWDLMIAHPPCTFLTCAGNKWYKPEYKDRFPTRLEDRQKAIDFFLSLSNTKIEKVCIENPIGIMSTCYRKPDQIIQPYYFGHEVRKTTALWLKNLPRLEATEIVGYHLDIFPSGNKQSKWHTETGHIIDKQERMKARSRTFEGIAKAMAQQWGR